jgi:hypothetical protein
MRTKALICAATLLAAGVATSMAQNVYSLNVVGYVQKVTPHAGKFVLLANPLNTTNNTIGGLIDTTATGLQANGQILKWGGSSFNAYKRVSTLISANGWSPSTAPAVSLNPGEGFFMQSPAASTLDITNTFVGEVLQSYSANTPASISNYLATGFTLTGVKIPVSNNISALSLTIPNVTGNQVLKWNIGGQTYNTFKRVSTLISSSGWSPNEPGVDVAEGFFTQLTAPITWLINFTVQ